jgi:hypothetical protein
LDLIEITLIAESNKHIQTNYLTKEGEKKKESSFSRQAGVVDNVY